MIRRRNSLTSHMNMSGGGGDGQEEGGGGQRSSSFRKKSPADGFNNDDGFGLAAVGGSTGGGGGSVTNSLTGCGSKRSGGGIARYEWSDLKLGELLGSGAFGEIVEVLGFVPLSNRSTHSNTSSRSSSNARFSAFDKNQNKLRNASQTSILTTETSALETSNYSLPSPDEAVALVEHSRKTTSTHTNNGGNNGNGDCQSVQSTTSSRYSAMKRRGSFKSIASNSVDPDLVVTKVTDLKQRMKRLVRVGNKSFVNRQHAMETASSAGANGMGTGPTRYVIKRVKQNFDAELEDDEHIDIERMQLLGIEDLVNEATILINLDHPNIIHLSGLASTNIDPLSLEFFIVLEKIDYTLTDKLKEWTDLVVELRHEDMNKCRLTFGSASPKSKSNLQKKKKQKELNCWNERLDVVLNIAYAMEYLHKNSVVYRDLKPDNVGFDREGTLKIFDFGLATPVRINDERRVNVDPNSHHRGFRFDDDRYELEGGTGSPRYMAPEVARHRPYSHKADVYSFGIVAWELLALKVPFEEMTVEQHYYSVVRGGDRPPMRQITFPAWTPNECGYKLRELVESCWSPQVRSRPSFEDIVPLLCTDICYGFKFQQPA